jgi:predicted HicB family RNase H-like nuclease
MSTLSEYKGYLGTVEYSAEDRCFHGKIAGIRDLVSDDGTTVDELETTFHGAVDEYLAFCKAEGKQPDQPFSGTFQLRLKGGLHKRLAIYAEEKHETLNAVANEAIEKMLTEGA